MNFKCQITLCEYICMFAFIIPEKGILQNKKKKVNRFEVSLVSEILCKTRMN